MGHSRILIPDKEWDLLGAHFGSEKESLKGLILALRLELVSSLPDCRGLFAVIRVHVVMPGRRARARAPTSYLYCCVSIV